MWRSTPLVTTGSSTTADRMGGCAESRFLMRTLSDLHMTPRLQGSCSRPPVVVATAGNTLDDIRGSPLAVKSIRKPYAAPWPPTHYQCRIPSLRNGYQSTLTSARARSTPQPIPQPKVPVGSKMTRSKASTRLYAIPAPIRIICTFHYFPPNTDRSMKLSFARNELTLYSKLGQ